MALERGGEALHLAVAKPGVRALPYGAHGQLGASDARRFSPGAAALPAVSTPRRAPPVEGSASEPPATRALPPAARAPRRPLCGQAPRRRGCAARCRRRGTTRRAGQRSGPDGSPRAVPRPRPRRAAGPGGPARAPAWLCPVAGAGPHSPPGPGGGRRAPRDGPRLRPGPPAGGRGLGGQTPWLWPPRWQRLVVHGRRPVASAMAATPGRAPHGSASRGRVQGAGPAGGAAPARCRGPGGGARGGRGQAVSTPAQTHAWRVRSTGRRPPATASPLGWSVPAGPGGLGAALQNIGARGRLEAAAVPGDTKRWRWSRSSGRPCTLSRLAGRRPPDQRE
jgi:hypothetical protein